MTSRDQSDDGQPIRTYRWVSADTFQATPFYKRGVEILKRDWLVFGWELLVDVAARLRIVALALFVLTLFAVDFALFVDTGFHPLYWLEHLEQLARTPGFIAGFAGLFVLSSLIITALRALVAAGTWGLVARGLDDKPIQVLRTFWGCALEWFPDVLSLYLVRFSLAVVNGLLGAAIAIGFYGALSTGRLAAMPGWQTTLLISAGLACYFAWTGLTKLVVTAAGAPLVIDDVDLGEALVRGAAFVLDNFWSLYRLFIFAAAVMLAPLAVYWVLVMIGNLAVIWPELGPLATVLRLAGDLLLFVSVSAVGVVFYAALFAFYRCDDLARPTPDPFGRGISLSAFKPDEKRNRKQNFLTPPSSPILDG